LSDSGFVWFCSAKLTGDHARWAQNGRPVSNRINTFCGTGAKGGTQKGEPINRILRGEGLGGTVSSQRAPVFTGRILTAKYVKYANKMQDNPILFAYFVYFAVKNSCVCSGGGWRGPRRDYPEQANACRSKRGWAVILRG
jgi:hypothetical protein